MMRINRKVVVLGVTLSAALSMLITGCDRPRQDPPPAAASTTVGTQIDDSVVTAKVKSALLVDPDINSFSLKVETRKGRVQLSGFVENQTQIDRAITITRAVEGVASVDNAVSLKGARATVGVTLDDSIITGKVKSALLADPDIKSFDIAVATRKGAVQLSGFVDSPNQINQAIVVARRVEGVTSIDNELSVKN